MPRLPRLRRPGWPSGLRRRLRPPRRLPRPWRLPAGCVLLGVLAGAGHALVTDREYAASAQLVVSGDNALGFAQAFGRVATDGAVLAAARTDAGVTVPELRDGVRVATSPDAPMIEITGTATDPAEAARAANAVARALTERGNGVTAATGVQIAVFTEASRHATPVSPSPAVSLTVGTFAGVLTGGLVLLTRQARPRAAPAAPEAGP